MKTIHTTLAIVTLMLAIPLTALAGRLTVADLSSLPAEEPVRAILLLGDRPDPAYFEQLVEGLARDERSSVVWQALLDWCEPTMGHMLAQLDVLAGNGKVVHVRPLRLVNGISLEAFPAYLIELASRTEVRELLDDRERWSDEGEWFSEDSAQLSGAGSLQELDEITWSLQQIGVPAVWDEGWNGDGVLIAVIDTGVNWRHHDLNDHLWDGGEEFPFHGYDFHDNDPDPMDTSGHGTAVAGILVGDGTSGTQTGIAPGATLMCLRVRSNLNLGRVADTWAAQDFALEHGADVTSMSLGWGNPAQIDRAIWRNNYDLLNAAGIVNVKSAGNRRESHQPPDAISVPGDVPSPWRNPQENSFGSRSGLITVGGLDRNDLFSSVSSPGPVTWQNEGPWFDFPLDALHHGLTKPDISAPCVEGWTTVYDDTTGYGGFSNTSMAQPHVAGTVALMLSKNHSLLPVQIDSILQTTALDLGVVGKDNDYGAGRVRADLAVAAVRWDVSVEREQGTAPQPSTFTILSLSPNPFNSASRLTFRMNRMADLNLSLFDILGRLIWTRQLGFVSPGDHTVTLSAHDLSSGMYFLYLEADGEKVTQKLLLLR